MPASLYSRRSRCFLPGCLALMLWGLSSTGLAQPPERFGENRPRTSTPQVRSQPTFGQQVDDATRRAGSHIKTQVEFTILLPQIGAAVEAQRWAKLLADLRVQAQFRSPLGTDEPGIDQHVRGTFRTVRVVGLLTDNGRLQLEDQVYSLDDARKLREWIETLQTYGAQGSPQGKPLWGLNANQFTEIYEALSVPVEEELEDLSLTEALSRLPLPPKYALRRLTAADDWLTAHPPKPIENRVQGLSCGTVLALVLSEAGLGFYPNRTPDGRIELQVQPLSQKGQVWPVGWELPEEVDHGELVPILHKFLEIGFEDVALQDVLDAAAAAIEVPILVDYHAIRKSGVDLAKKSVSYPTRRTTWGLMLNTIIRKAHLIRQVRRDERGTPLVFITPFVSAPVER